MLSTSRQLSSSKQGKTPECVIDRSVFNADTIADVADLGVSFFASLCGRNRGVFVLDPPDGNSYGCIEFPPNYAELAGVDTDVPLEDTNAINLQFLGGNLTASDTVELLDFFVQRVYGTTPNTGETPYGCDVGGLAALQCGDAKPSLLSDGSPIRSVTVAGTFVPLAWVGPKLSLREISKLYTAEDFHDMAELGLNAVQIPVFTSAFESGNEDVKDAVGDMLELADAAGLGAILVLVEDESSEGTAKDVEDAVIAAAEFSSSMNAVIAITLPSPDSSLVAAARTVVSTLPLLLPINQGYLRKLHSDDPNVYASLSLSHTTTVADVASSTSTDDRMKMFYHEATSCIARSPIEYASCYKQVPVLISSGFDLAIDDCVNQDGKTFKDYGQCGRFEETVDSNWWHRHRKSFAARQVFAYERGLGWSFATWKFHGDGSSEDTTGVIDTPAKLLSLKDVAAAGLMPSLKKKSVASLACLNGPEPDFILGDDTLAPTPGPPPDCGNGWWNFTTSKCDYWVPPPPTPTPKCEPSGDLIAPSHKALGLAALGGAAGTAIIGAIVLMFLGGKRGGYSELP